MQSIIEVGKDVFGNWETLFIFGIGVTFFIALWVHIKHSPYLKNKLIALSVQSNSSGTRSQLAWEITDAEMRMRTHGRVKRTISFIFPPLVAVGAVVYFGSGSMIFPMLVLGGVFLWVVFVYGSVYVFAHNGRKYIVDSAGIFVAKGETNRRYAWEEFEYFFGSPDRRIYPEQYKNKVFREEYIRKLNSIEGEDFFLKLKSKDAVAILQDVLVIHTNPDKCGMIREALSQKLPERSGLSVAFVRYQFK